jgi:hypothetical protein
MKFQTDALPDFVKRGFSMRASGPMKPGGFLSRFRFSLAGAMVFITVVATCIGAHANGSHLAELGLRYLTTCLVLAALLVALFNGPTRRPFSSGFAFGTLLHWFMAGGGSYHPDFAEVILGFSGSVDPQLNMLHASLSLVFGFLAGLLARALVLPA